MEKNKMYEDFNKALKEFNDIKFNKEVKYSGRDFKYADLSEIYRCVKEPLLQNGFIIISKLKTFEGKSYLETSIVYKDGSILAETDFPIDTANKKMQDIGSQITYVKRYQISSLLSLSAEEDDDAFDLKECISPEQLNNINALLNGLEYERFSDLLKILKIKSFSDIKKDDYTDKLSFIKRFVNNKGVNYAK